MPERFATSAFGLRISDFGFPSDFGPRISDFRAAGFALSLTSVTLEHPWIRAHFTFLGGSFRFLTLILPLTFRHHRL